MTIKNILVPIDFSKPSLSAVEFALPLAKRFAAGLHLLHVFEPDLPNHEHGRSAVDRP